MHIITMILLTYLSVNLKTVLFKNKAKQTTTTKS